MQVQIEDVSPVEKKLTFEIPWEDVQARMADAYKELSKGVALKGFRKGKVPESVIRKMFGKQVRAEVAGQLVRDSFLQAVQQHELQVVSEPRMHDPQIEAGKPFTFHAHVEVRTPVALEKSDYEGLELERRVVTVTDEQVDESLQQLRRQHTDLQPIEGRDITARTDVLSMSIKGTIGDNELDRPEFMLDLEDTAREPLPGMIKALTGIPTNASDYSFTLSFPDDHQEPSLAGKSAELTVTITDARAKQVPELDDEFAKDTERAESLDQLRQVLRAEIEERVADEVSRELRDGAVKALVAKNPIPVADGLVTRAADHQLRRLKAMIGLPADRLDAGLDGEMLDRMRDAAADDVRGEFLVDAVATAESIEVTDEDVDARIASMATRQGKTAQRLRAELDRDDRLDDLQFSIRREKTLDLIIERATIRDVERSEGERAQAAAAPADAPAAVADLPAVAEENQE